ncbi:rhodanese-like domain-containing protein [Streptococcus anginosus]|uniref:Rhodanese-like domain-containing protein n=1 Tax=Streptococcus anginosus TaxID=1328 RepID=A0A2T0GAP1_STRAP|nr:MULTISPECIES: rhodanese-like domain-containing protein [Streptococcus]MBX9075171.1 rhodanese-like domain-containing protein [Streptococcus anginosus]MBX9101207.1 rhodanese-like domain-containing protein [Streptococcus anginosus]PRT73785.1 rhodanese-like domain-containing protein [Streptococcus anginosus]VEE12207.1 rhodanese-like domain-containing protein [Streptococcus milleri]VTS29801.1 rhodanese-like domain-containing protein [Streptococcus anginosus]
MEISITMSEFYKKYQAEKLSIIDVREAYEFASGHVPTAQNLPLSSLEAGYKQLSQQEKYYVICQSGARSAAACQFLSAQGFDVTNVAGGMNIWPGEVE